MENYTYKGISGSKYISGEIEALNLDEASHKLKQQKIIITNITMIQKKGAAKTKEKKKGSKSSLFKKKITPQDTVVFSKQFATMVKAGLPILGTLQMLRDQTEHPLSLIHI